MQSRIFIFVYIILWAMVLAGCEKHLLAPDPQPDNLAVFDHLWEDVYKRYSYFELKSIDWHAIRSAYRPLVTEHISEYELFDILAEMLHELRDGHVNLTSSFDRSRNWQWYLDYPENYHHRLVEQHYLGSDYRITGPLLNQMIEGVLYVNYRSFSDAISPEHLDELIERAADSRGVIIDVRSNGGGSLSHANRLASAFAPVQITYAMERIKTGPAPDDFSAWWELRSGPRDGSVFNGPVVVLANRRSFSATTFFVQMMRVHSNAVIMGDYTGGGGGIPVFGELPNGWVYRFSASQALSPDDEHLELGILPDIPVDMQPEDEQSGMDSIIEAALELLR